MLGFPAATGSVPLIIFRPCTPGRKVNVSATALWKQSTYLCAQILKGLVQWFLEIKFLHGYTVLFYQFYAKHSFSVCSELNRTVFNSGKAHRLHLPDLFFFEWVPRLMS